MEGPLDLVNKASGVYPGRKDEEQDEDEDIFSSRRHLMDYVTPEGIIKRTGYSDKRDWYLLVIKELYDNAIDWLWNEYPGSTDSKIINKIVIDNKNFNFKIRNTNPKNIPVFEHLQHIFNYEMTYGSKQNEFKISRGTLGDAMKFVLAIPYVLINLDRDKSNDFSDKQWKTPMYIRHNGIEQKVFIVVDEASNTIEAQITPVEQAKKLAHTDTEIEVTYPMLHRPRSVIFNTDTKQWREESPNFVTFEDVVYYCKTQKAGTTDINFEIEIIDKTIEEKDTPAKTEKLVQKATHSISKNWVNIPSVRAYTPQEFRKKIFGVHDKSTSIYKVLRTFREGTQLKKRPDLDVPIATLVKDPKKVRGLYYELRDNSILSKAKSPSKKISLPYSTAGATATEEDKEEE